MSGLIQRRRPAGGGPSAERPGVERSLQAGTRSVSDLIVPGQLELERNYFVLDDQYCRAFTVANWPREVDSGWLERFYRIARTYDLSFHLDPLSNADAESQMRMALVRLESERMGRGTRIADAKQYVQDADLSNLRVELVAGKERLLTVMVFYVVRAVGLAELEQGASEIRQALREIELDVRPLLFEQLEGLMSTLPLGAPALSRPRRNLPSGALATVFPFGDAPFESSRGLYYGEDRVNGRMLIYDPFGGPNYNSMVLGRSGGGKSYTIKTQLLQHLLAGTPCIIIDPENEYRFMADALGGDIVHIGPSSHDHINPFDLIRYEQAEDDEVDALTEKVIFLKALVDLMTARKTEHRIESVLDPFMRNLLDEMLYKVYALRGITKDPSTHNRPAPIFRELFDLLRDERGETAQALAGLLHEFAQGAYASFFNQKTNVDLSKRLLVFDIQTTPSDVRPVITSMITDFVWSSARLDRRRRVFVIDEIWQLLRHEQLAAVVSGMFKRSRKYGLGIIAITQDVADFLASDAGRSALANSEIRIILGQRRGAPIDSLREALGLSEEALFAIENSGPGEGIFQFGSRTFHVQGTLMPPKIHRLITTNPAERREIERGK